MANHKSALKRHRQSLRRRTRNRMVKASTRTAVKKFRRALEDKQVENYTETCRELFKIAEKRLQSAASKGVLKDKTVARSISRLNEALKKAQAAE
jgi:small subunit ribosomal protein S20